MPSQKVRPVQKSAPGLYGKNLKFVGFSITVSAEIIILTRNV